MDEILAQLFPQAPSYFPGLLGQEQANLLQQQAQRQGLLGIGMGLLQAAAPSTTRSSLGAGIAQGLSAGQQMAQNVYAQRLQEQQIAQKLAEQQRTLQQQAQMRQLFPQIFQTVTERGALAGEEGPVPLESQRISISPEKLSMMAAISPDPLASLASISKILPELRKGGVLGGMAMGADPFLAFMGENIPASIRSAAQQYSRAYQSGAIDEATAGQRAESLAKMVESVAKPVTPIASYEYYVRQEQAAGRTPKSYEQYEQDMKKAGAQTIVEKTSGVAAGELVRGAIERANASLNNASAASQTLQTIADIRPALDQGVMSGPLSSQTAIVARLASTLGVTGQSTQDTLNRTAEAMRGLAQLELQAAEQMRGQGAITEGERGLIARAAAGNLATMTAGEVRTLLNAMERTAKFKIQSYNQNLGILRRALPEESRQFVDVYPTIGVETQPRTSIGSAGSAARAAGLVREE
jgi:hypothetical protein